MTTTKTHRELDALFPPNAGARPSGLSDELSPGETVIWSGGPERWGLFRITPFLQAVAGFVVLLTIVGIQQGYAGPFDFLQRFLLTRGGTDALIVPGLALLLVVLMLWWMRDPRGKWQYVVTDRRLLVFYRGKKLREADPDELDNLRILRGIERRLRNLGHVVWRIRIRTDGSTGGGGPDAGQHGFRGMRDPQQWYERLLEWRETLRNASRKSSTAFVDGDERTGGRRRVRNDRFGFTIDVPEDWSGKAGTWSKEPLRILGIRTPMTKTRIANSQPIGRARGDWDCLRLRGAVGDTFDLDVRPGQATHDFETFTSQIEPVIQASDKNVVAGSLKGWSVDYTMNEKGQLVCYTLLQGDDYHIVINACFSEDDVAVHRRAISAVLDSIDTRD